MPLAILVVDRHSALEKSGDTGGIERLGRSDVEDRFHLVEEKASVAVRRGDQRLARLRRDREILADLRLGAVDQGLQSGLVEPMEDQHLAA